MSGGGGSTTIKDTPQQKALAKIAAQRFNLYQQYFVPLENQFIAESLAQRDPSTFDNVSAFVSAVQQPDFQRQISQIQQQQFQQGVDPTSGQFVGRSRELSEGQARGMGLGTAEALSGQVDRYYQGLQNIIALGEGQAGTAVAGLSDVAQMAQRTGAAEAKTAFQRGQAVPTAVGTGLGLGIGYGLAGRTGGDG
jgi:hypothetical protein